MKALFFIRHHNDFDSLAAVADGWVAASPDNRATLFFASPAMRWRNDFRTAMLARNPRIDFADLWQVAGVGAGGWLERLWAGNLPDRRMRRRLVEAATELRAAPGFDARMTAWLDRLAPDIVAFDWWDVPQKRKPFDHFGYQAAIAWTRRTGVPLVSLPHGLFIYWRKKAFAISWKTPYDCIFVENEKRGEMFRQGGHGAGQVAVCGAPRYDSGWVARVLAELGASDADDASGRPPDGRVRITFFDKRATYYFDFAEHLEWLLHLADHPAVDLVIQPHPRGQKLGSLKRLVDHPSIAIDPRTPASLLIRRSDIVSTLTSSVMVEAVMTGREILFPRFLTTVNTLFDEKGACVALASGADTHAAIDRYLAGERVPRANYEAFLIEAVWGGQGPHTISRIVARMAAMAGAAAPAG